MKRVLVAVFVVLAVSAGVDALADLTQDRADHVVRGSRSEIVLHVSSRDRTGSDLRSAEGLWGACQGTVWQRLAEAGIRTVVDLRAEEGIEHDAQVVDELGMKLVRIPIRDGQTPTSAEVDEFLAAVRASDGTVFVHCGAGVGRTGAMVGAYQVAEGELDRSAALRNNLAVGPPSLEQIAFVARMDIDDGQVEKPGRVVTAVSRVLDAPRRAWSRWG